jgi:uncharacterized membrane protein
MWTLGFITGSTKGEVQERTAEEVINVFVPAQDIIRLKMPIEDGLKLVVSGGIVTPPVEAAALPAASPTPES